MFSHSPHRSTSTLSSSQSNRMSKWFSSHLGIRHEQSDSGGEEATTRPPSDNTAVGTEEPAPTAGSDGEQTPGHLSHFRYGNGQYWEQYREYEVGDEDNNYGSVDGYRYVSPRSADDVSGFETQDGDPDFEVMEEDDQDVPRGVIGETEVCNGDETGAKQTSIGNNGQCKLDEDRRSALKVKIQDRAFDEADPPAYTEDMDQNASSSNLDENPQILDPIPGLLPMTAVRHPNNPSPNRGREVEGEDNDKLHPRRASLKERFADKLQRVGSGSSTSSWMSRGSRHRLESGEWRERSERRDSKGRVKSEIKRLSKWRKDRDQTVPEDDDDDYDDDDQFSAGDEAGSETREERRSRRLYRRMRQKYEQHSRDSSRSRHHPDTLDGDHEAEDKDRSGLYRRMRHKYDPSKSRSAFEDEGVTESDAQRPDSESSWDKVRPEQPNSLGAEMLNTPGVIKCLTAMIRETDYSTLLAFRQTCSLAFNYSDRLITKHIDMWAGGVRVHGTRTGRLPVIGLEWQPECNARPGDDSNAVDGGDDDGAGSGFRRKKGHLPSNSNNSVLSELSLSSFTSGLNKWSKGGSSTPTTPSSLLPDSDRLRCVLGQTRVVDCTMMVLHPESQVTKVILPHLNNVVIIRLDAMSLKEYRRFSLKLRAEYLVVFAPLPAPPMPSTLHQDPSGPLWSGHTIGHAKSHSRGSVYDDSKGRPEWYVPVDDDCPVPNVVINIPFDPARFDLASGRITLGLALDRHRRTGVGIQHVYIIFVLQHDARVAAESAGVPAAAWWSAMRRDAPGGSGPLDTLASFVALHLEHVKMSLVGFELLPDEWLRFGGDQDPDRRTPSPHWRPGSVDGRSDDGLSAAASDHPDDQASTEGPATVTSPVSQYPPGYQFGTYNSRYGRGPNATQSPVVSFNTIGSSGCQSLSIPQQQSCFGRPKRSAETLHMHFKTALLGHGRALHGWDGSQTLKVLANLELLTVYEFRSVVGEETYSLLTDPVSELGQTVDPWR